MKTSTIIAVVVATSVVLGSAVVTGSGGSTDTRILSYSEKSYHGPTTSTIVSVPLTEHRGAYTYKMIISENFDGPTDMTNAEYPTWLVRSFALSLGVLAVGLMSVLYVGIIGISSMVLAGTYLVPIGLTAAYYLLGIAERNVRN